MNGEKENADGQRNSIFIFLSTMPYAYLADIPERILRMELL